MPTREPIDEEMIEKARNQLQGYVEDFRRYPCNATLAMLIINLYEVAIIIFSYKSGSETANYKYLSRSITSNFPTYFIKLRDNIVHNFKNIKSVYEEVSYRLSLFGKEAFNQIVKECYDDCNLYSEIMYYCQTQNDAELETLTIFN